MRTAGRLGAAAALAVLLTGTANAAVPRLDYKARIVSHSYKHKVHHVGGKVRLRNTGSDGIRVECRAVVTLSEKDGGKVKRSANVRATVGAHAKRTPHFHVKLPDPTHRFENVPKHAAAHCNKV